MRILGAVLVCLIMSGCALFEKRSEALKGKNIKVSFEINTDETIINLGTSENSIKAYASRIRKSSIESLKSYSIDVVDKNASGDNSNVIIYLDTVETDTRNMPTLIGFKHNYEVVISYRINLLSNKGELLYEENHENNEDSTDKTIKAVGESIALKVARYYEE